MDERNYHPQQDVFRLIDGKKETVRPYRFANQQTKAVKQTEPHLESIVFDGQVLTTTAIDETGAQVKQQLPAVSGEPAWGEFDYSDYRQKMPSKGPIPEGKYFINPQDVQRPTAWDNVVSLLSSTHGAYPGGRRAWGECRIPIQLTEQQKEKTDRKNFFIHGGTEPGSAGCIDLTVNEEQFCDFIEKYRGKNQKKVPLEVKYPDELKNVSEEEENEI